MPSLRPDGKRRFRIASRRHLPSRPQTGFSLCREREKPRYNSFIIAYRDKRRQSSPPKTGENKWAGASPVRSPGISEDAIPAPFASVRRCARLTLHREFSIKADESPLDTAGFCLFPPLRRERFQGQSAEPCPMAGGTAKPSPPCAAGETAPGASGRGRASQNQSSSPERKSEGVSPYHFLKTLLK